MDIWVRNVERTPTKINTRFRYIIIKILKDKERIANAARKKTTCCIQGPPYTNNSGFLCRNLVNKEEVDNIFKMQKEKKHKPATENTIYSKSSLQKNKR